MTQIGPKPSGYRSDLDTPQPDPRQPDLPSSPKTVKIPREVLFFAIAWDLAKTRSLTLSLDGNLTMGQFREILQSVLPDLGPHLPSCALALDGVVVKDTDLLGTAKAIAVLPPVSGG